MKPNTSANSARIITATVNWVGDTICSDSVMMAASRMPSTGTPEPSAHTVIVRPMMPGAKRCGGGPTSSACAATGRSANSVNR